MTNARGHGARNGTLFEAPLDSLSVDRFTDEKPRDRHGEASLGVNGKNAEELHIMIENVASQARIRRFSELLAFYFSA